MTQKTPAQIAAARAIAAALSSYKAAVAVAFPGRRK